MRWKPKGSLFNYHRGFIKAKTSQFWRNETGLCTPLLRRIPTFAEENSRSLSLSLTSRAYLSTRHAPENKLPPSPEGHISEAEGSSLSLNKRPTQTDGFVQTAPDALKAGTGSPPRQMRRRNAHLPLRWKPNRRKHINIELHHCWCETVRL